MSNPFERMPNQDKVEEAPRPSEQFDADAQEQIARIDSIQPTGDPVADAITYDEITNNGRLRRHFDSPQNALRVMVESREAALKAIERQTDTAALPLRTLIRERDVAAMDRILSYYGVHEKTLAEYDQRTG